MKHLACFCVSGMVQLILCIHGCYRKLCLSWMEARGEAGSWRLLGAEDWGIGAGSWEKRGKRSWLSRRGAAGVALLSTQTITRSAGERRRIVTLRLYSVTADLQVSLPVFWLYLTRAALEWQMEKLWFTGQTRLTDGLFYIGGPRRTSPVDFKVVDIR